MNLISIIVPIYNVEDYLCRCIDSLLNQSYKNIEILLINDGSTDNSGHICEQYKKNYKNVYVYHKENGGVSSARNMGLEKVNIKSKYVAFVDPDDFIHPNMYKILHENLVKYDSDISICNFEKTDSNLTFNVTNNITVMESKDAIDDYFSNFDLFNYVWNKLYKKECLQGICFEHGRILQDQMYSPQVIYNSKKIVITDAKLYYYYQREGSAMNGGFDPNKNDDLRYATESYAKFAKKIRLKKFSSNASERYMSFLLDKIYIAYKYNNDDEYHKLKKMYRRAIRSYILKVINSNARVMYLLYYINPKLYIHLKNKI